jgi:hypothetical protein
LIMIGIMRLCLLDIVYAEGMGFQGIGEYYHAELLNKQVKEGNISLEDAQVRYVQTRYFEMSPIERRDHERAITKQLQFDMTETYIDRVARLGYDDCVQVLQNYELRERIIKDSLIRLPKLPNAVNIESNPVPIDKANVSIIDIIKPFIQDDI